MQIQSQFVSLCIEIQTTIADPHYALYYYPKCHVGEVVQVKKKVWQMTWL